MAKKAAVLGGAVGDGEEEEEAGHSWEGCGGCVCIRPSPRAALHTEDCCGWRKGLPGEPSASPLLGQGSSQLYFGRGGGSDALRRAVGVAGGAGGAPE